MKKIYFALTVVAAAALVSCEREKSFDELTPLGENDIAFVLKGEATRSAVLETPTAVHGVSIPVGTDKQGNALFLEETIEELNPSPATKGAPAYTLNVGTLYTTMGVYAEDLGDATFEVMDMYDHKGDPSDPNAPITAGPDAEKGDGWRYHHNYNGSPWPEDENEKVDFYLRMPAQIDGLSNLTNENKQISFDFTPLNTAKDQTDILFSQTSLSKSEHDGYLPNGAPVLMYHALTGVKFRSGSNNSGATKTIITGVKITGLKGTGHCVIDGSNIVWTPGTSTSYTYTQTFTNPAYSQTAWVDGTVTYEKGTDPQFGDSWYSAAADRNLNNDAGELTFWFIPQVITDKVKLEVTFCIKTPDTSGETGGGEFTHQIDFGEILAAKNVEWKAGQLRTYTLEPRDVDVEIFDTMSGNSKTALHVTNTGNVAEYVRMLVIGNWYGWESEEDQAAGKEPDILVGYKTDGSGGENDNAMVKPWYREEPEYGQYFDATFTNGKPTGDNKWVRGTTGFYYPDPLGPGDQMDPDSDALFKSYIWPEDVPFPTIYIPDPNSNIRKPAVGVHLIMEVVIQAIGVELDDEGQPTKTCWEAWTEAVGSTIEPK